MASFLEQLMGQKGPSLPSNLSERKQMVDLAKETPEMQDLVETKGGQQKKGFDAKTTTRKKTIQGRELESLLKMLMTRGMSRDQAMEKVRSMGMLEE